jgi:hemoglobin/transferrin/lactoferrin receptor protein
MISRVLNIYKENKMKYGIFCLFLGCCGLHFSQVISVKNSETNEVLPYVSFASKVPKVSAITDSKGKVDLSKFKNSEEIQVRLHGFETIILSYETIVSSGNLISMKMAAFSLDEIVVSASKWEQSKRDIPNKISSLTPKDVALLNPQTAADLLASSGEVFVQKSQQGGGSPMIRGFSTNRLLYTVDGVRMNNAIFRGGNIQNVISLDPLAIENAEIFFGPGSIIYGSDAIGGVMSFKTLTPQLSNSEETKTTGKAMSRYSSANNEKTAHFDVGVGFKKWSILTSITHSDYGDLLMGKKGSDFYLKKYHVERINDADQVVENKNPRIQNPTGYSQTNLMQKIRFKPNENWDFQYGFHYSETSEYSRYDRMIETTSNGLPSSAVWNYGPQIWMMNQLSIGHSKSTTLYDEFNIRIAQQRFEESRIDRRFNHHRLRTQLEKVDAFSFNIDFSKLVGKSKFFYGFEGVKNHVNSTGSALNITTGAVMKVADRYPKSEWNSYAAYLSYQYRLSEKVILQTGGRFNQFNIESDFTRHLEFYPYDFTTAKINNNAVTGSLGFIFNPSKKLNINFNTSTGFRAPNVDDIGKLFDFQLGEVVVPNPNLKAEYAYNAEVGISKIVGKILKIETNFFGTLLDNAMVRREFQLNNQDSILYDGVMSKTYAIQNAASANVYGANVGFDIKLAKGFGISSRLNYQIGTEEMDDGTVSRSRHAAPFFGVFRLSYQDKKLSMQVYAMYSAEVSYENLNEEERLKKFLYVNDANGNPYSPSWYTINFKAMYQMTENFSVSAGVENIGDIRYRPYSSGLVAPGRNFVISLTAKL